MARGRPRSKAPANLPEHIDYSRVPKGIYWDPSGTGRWYVRDRDPDGPGWLTPTVANHRAKLSDLHTIAEQRAGRASKGSLSALMTAFHSSLEFRKRAPATRKDYDWCREVLEHRKLASGMTWGSLLVDRITVPFVQRLVEAIAAGNPDASPPAPAAPAKANHVLRYLRRLCAWGIRFGYCTTNPATGVKQAEERGRISMPAHDAFGAVLAYARTRGAKKAHSEGSSPSYLAPLMHIAYLCRLRGIEAVTLTEGNATDEGILSNRRKGSRDNITRWTPELRAAWQSAIARRDEILSKDKHRMRPTQIRPEDRPIWISEDAMPLSKGAVDQAWQKLMKAAIKDGIITEEQRFTLHGLKHRGITDSADKASGGHRTEQMRQHYDHEIPVVDAAKFPTKAAPTLLKIKESGKPDQ